MNKVGKSLMTFSIGAAAGALAGLLLAPSSGNKTRKSLRTKVSNISTAKTKDTKSTLIDLSEKPYFKEGMDDYIYNS
jgi:gas vesicle protein